MASEVAILIPVLNRPHRIEPLLANIAENTPEQHRIIFAASDQPTINELERLGAWYVRDEGGTYPIRINHLFNETDEPFVFLGADDLKFWPDWFRQALIIMEETKGVVAVNDMYNVAGTHFLVSRQYINELGGCIDEPGIVLHEGYLHTYCDDELRCVAKRHDRFALANQSIVEHLHVGAGKSPMDDVYKMGEQSMAQGHTLFTSRAHLWAV